MEMDPVNSNNGPDQVIPTTKSYTSDISDYVCLKIPKSGKAIETIPPISVPGLLHRSATQYVDHPALAYKTSGKWKKISYREYEEQVRTCAKAFLHLGLERHHGVCIIGFNSPEWFISSLAAMYAGGVSAGVYTTNSSSACLHCAECAKANIIVVQDEKQLKKIIEIKDKLPSLKAIIQYEGEPLHEGVLSWKRVMEIGKQQTDEKLDNVLKTIAINECCMLIYTSGTVGKPKAVMISHDNITWNAVTILERLHCERMKEELISYLPLSHIAAQLLDIFLCITIGATVYFADSNALKGSLINTLQDVRPTYFLGVPRVWEKMYEKMKQIAAQSGPLKKAIANWAKQQGLEHNMNKMKGVEYATWGYTLADWLVLKRIKHALGLDRCKFTASAAAPLASELKKYFLSIDIPIMDVFGMSEASGAHTLTTSNSLNLDSVGQTLPGMKTKISEPDGQNNGEICLYGRHVFMGYLNEPEKTKEAITDEGWLRSGDVGYVDKQGFVYITGRIKELLITAGGENIPPVAIEQQVIHELPHISNVMLIGDKRKFLSLLITLKTEVDSEATPLDNLTPEVKQWLTSLGCPAETVTEVLKAGPDSRLLNAIQEGINTVNKHSTSNAQRIQKFVILPADFSIPTGELGPTLKLRRNIVLAKYAAEIEKMYG